MKRFYIIVYILTILSATLLLLLGGHWFQSHSIVAHNQMYVVCTTTLIADVVSNVGGNNLTVDCLMGPGVDPHLYRARESDIHKLAAAHIIFYNGLHLEGKMSDIFTQMNASFAQQTIPVSNALSDDQLLFVGQDIHDPHVWHDVQLWKQVALFIGQVLGTFDPAHAAEYASNAQKYADQLEQLDLYVHKHIATVPKDRRILVTAHDAFSYFGRAYGITVVGLQGVSTQVQVGTKDIQNLADYIVEHTIPALFVESSVPDRTLAAVMQAVAARGFTVKLGDALYSDALGLKETQAGTYVGMIKHNVDALVTALSK